MKERLINIRHAQKPYAADNGARSCRKAAAGGSPEMAESALVPENKDEEERLEAQSTRRHRGPLFWVILVFAVIVLAFVIVDRCTGIPIYYFDGTGATYDFRCDTDDFYHVADGEENKLILKSISVAADDADGYDAWMDVLKLVAGTNANVVQADDVMPADFYHALSDYNAGSDTKLYLLQRVRLGHDAYTDMVDLYSGKVPERLLDKGKLAIDAVHGRRNIDGYFWDVSSYVVGYAVGDDWDPKLVAYSQDLMEGVTYEYTGQYFSCKSSFTYFEAKMAQTMNDMCYYETHKYNHQTPIGFWNWTYTDQISQTYAFIETYDGIAIITQSVIVASKGNNAGTFAAFHLFDSTDPLISMDTDYAAYVDEYGDANPFEAYVKDVVSNANGPAVIAAVSVSSARGVSGIDAVSGRNRGDMDEKGQGTLMAAMVGDIYRAGGKGFTIPLYDDVTANTWNTVAISDANGLWDNVQSTDAHTGLVGYTPTSAFRVDGDPSEWASITPVVSSDDGVSVKMACDESYVYFDVTVPGLDATADTLYIPLDVTPLSGSTTLVDTATGGSLAFDREADFVIRISGTDNSEMLVQQYYDYLYSIAGSLLYDVDTSVDKPARDSTTFDEIYQYTSPLLLGSDGVQMTYFPATSLLTGKLTYGDADPDDEDYDSLADFCFGTDTVEIRIPWALLNFYDPASCTILGDFFDGDGQRTLSVDSIWAGLIVNTASGGTSYTSGAFALSGWSEFSEVLRVKQSYALVADMYDYIPGEE